MGKVRACPVLDTGMGVNSPNTNLNKGKKKWTTTRLASQYLPRASIRASSDWSPAAPFPSTPTA